MKDILIIGAGGCGREVVQWIKDINSSKPTWNIKGFLDVDMKMNEDLRSEFRIIGVEQEYIPQENDVFVCSIGNQRIRKEVIERTERKGGEFVNVVHPTAIVADTAVLGKAEIIYPYTIISDNAVIGDGCIINMHTSVAHDVIMGEYCTLSAHCDVTGACRVGDRVFMGTSSHMVPGTRVGNDVYICAGSTVMTRVKEGKKVLGNPARAVDF